MKDFDISYLNDLNKKSRLIGGFFYIENPVISGLDVLV